MQPIEYHLKVLAEAPVHAGAAPTMEKAAHEIERLRLELAGARAALWEVPLPPSPEAKAWMVRHAAALKTVREVK